MVDLIDADLHRPGAPVREVRDFDFRRPAVLSREHVRSMQIVQESLARGFTTTLASLLRAAISVTIADVDQHTYHEYISAVPNPTLLANLSIAPLEGSALLQIPLRSAYMAIELLLGGRGGPDQPARALTDVESILVRSILDMLLGDIDRAFEPIASITSAITSQETNPQFAQMASPTDMVIVVSFDLSIENVTETMSLCVPLATLQGRLEAMSTRAQQSAQSAEKAALERALLLERTAGVEVSSAASFRPGIMSSRELSRLAIGDVLALNHPVSMPLTLSVEGVGTHEVAIGRVNRRYAVQVVGEVDPEVTRRPARVQRVDPPTGAGGVGRG